MELLNKMEFTGAEWSRAQLSQGLQSMGGRGGIGSSSNSGDTEPKARPNDLRGRKFSMLDIEDTLDSYPQGRPH